MGALRLPLSPDPRDGERFLLDVDRRLERLDRGLLLAEWAMFAGRPRADADALQLRRTRLLAEPGLLEWTRKALRRDWPDPMHRRLQLLERIALLSRVEQSPKVVQIRGRLQRRIVQFRPLWNGKRVNRVVVHRTLFEGSDAVARRRAYYALQPLHHALEEPLRELVRLRNEGAVELGFPTFAEMRLGFDGLTVARLEELTDAAVVPGRRALRGLRDAFYEQHPDDGWHPWDFAFARHDRVRLPERSFPRRGMVSRVLAAADRWGFRTSRMRFRVVFHDLPSGGMTLAPNPPTDVRIMVHPDGGWTAHMILFHEVGHAVHSASIRAPPHLLHWSENVPGFGPFHEGVGGFFEEIPSRAEWLASRPGSPAPAPKRTRRRPAMPPRSTRAGTRAG